MSDPLDRMMTEVIMQRDALAARMYAAEALLEQADDIIEILLGDERHLHAEDLRAAIENHWQTYEPEAR
jgi:hypothetical protein